MLELLSKILACPAGFPLPREVEQQVAGLSEMQLIRLHEMVKLGRRG